MEIKPISFSDLDRINSLILKEFPYTKSKTDSLRKRLEEKRVMIFKGMIDEKFVGFIDIEFLEPETARINGISIIEKFRGEGYSKDLLNYAISFLDKTGYKKVFLLVREDNKIAKKLYSSLNFRFEEYSDKKICDKKIEKWSLRRNSDSSSYNYMNIVGIWIW